jgi:selenide,water dikinase
VDPRVLVGTETSDDAGVYLVAEGLALVQTVDYFTPVVDDPYDFGRVAAANALSDVYAMGAEPFMALNLVGFPTGILPLSVLQDILRGGAAVCGEAGVAVVGGHSIDDPEPKFGLAVTGRARPEDIWLNRTARDGDLLVLTKPLGIGILTTAIKRGRLSPEEIRAAVDLMTTLNRDAADAAREVGVHAATDVSGYGLLGHLHEMAHGSGLEAEVWAGEVPFLSARVRELAAEGVVPGGSKRNLQFVVEKGAVFEAGLAPEEEILLADAQTSGGLLLAVGEDRAPSLVAALRARKTPAAATVGRLRAGRPGVIRVLRNRPA